MKMPHQIIKSLETLFRHGQHIASLVEKILTLVDRSQPGDPIKDHLSDRLFPQDFAGQLP